MNWLAGMAESFDDDEDDDADAMGESGAGGVWCGDREPVDTDRMRA